MVSAIFELLKVGLDLWSHKEKTKYAERVLKLEKEYYEESKKDTPNNALLDDIEFELHLIVSGFTSKAKRSTSDNLQK